MGTLLATGSITDRYLGYTKSLMEHGVAVRGDWTIADRDIHTGKIDMDRLLQLPKEMPTAFVCNCDLTASFLIRRLHEHARIGRTMMVHAWSSKSIMAPCAAHCWHSKPWH